MKICLFAANQVGLEAMRAMRGVGMPPEALVLASQDRSGVNDALRAEMRACSAGPVVSSDGLDSDGIATLRSLGLDLGILAWWPHIIGRELIEVFRLGCLNFHPSLLPHNRGKDPNFWALVEERPFGVTLHFVDEGVDSGDIAFQRPIPVGWEDTGETLYHKAQREIVALFREKLPEIAAGRIPRVPQDAGMGSFHRRRELDAASRIDLDATHTARDLLNLLRARTFPPHPGAWFEDGYGRFQVRVQISRVDDEASQEVNPASHSDGSE